MFWKIINVILSKTKTIFKFFEQMNVLITIVFFFFYTECNSSTKHNTTFVVRIDLVSLFSLNFLIFARLYGFPRLY